MCPSHTRARYRTILKSTGRTLSFHPSCDRRIRFLGQIQNRIRLTKLVLVCDPVRKSVPIFKKSQVNVFDLRSSYDHRTTFVRTSDLNLEMYRFQYKVLRISYEYRTKFVRTLHECLAIISRPSTDNRKTNH